MALHLDYFASSAAYEGTRYIQGARAAARNAPPVRDHRELSCPYDLGFDRETGPFGCQLDLIEGLHGCVCAGLAPAPPEMPIVEDGQNRDAIRDVCACLYVPAVHRVEYSD